MTGLAAPEESSQINQIVKMLHGVHAHEPRQTSVPLAGHLGCGFESFLCGQHRRDLRQLPNPNRARPPLQHSDNTRFLVQPLPESRRAGMAAEDEPISVNGVPFTGMAGLIRQTFYAHPGQTFSIVYRNRLVGMHTAQVGLMAQRRAPPNFSGWLNNIVLVALFP